MKNKFLQFFAVLSGVILASCGGGGISSVSNNLATSVAAGASQPGVTAAAAAAAKATPKSGSVIQGGSDSFFSNTSTVSIVEGISAENGIFTASIIIDDNVISTENPENFITLTSQLMGEDGNSNPYDVYRAELQTVLDSSNTVYIHLYSNITPDTDYLAAGFWFYTPTADEGASAYRVGAFVDPSAPTALDDLPASGRATYSGAALAYRVQTGEAVQEIDFLDVRLTANFLGENSTIGGRITTNRLDTPDDGPPNRLPYDIILGEARQDSNIFTGDTSVEGEDYAGKWGVQFHDQDATGEIPGSAAGTFGIANEDNTDSVIGAFITDCDTGC